jgi:hypothetical protein
LSLPPRRIALDPDLRCADAIEFENKLNACVIGQPEAVALVQD